MNNKDAVRILKSSAKLFHEELENNNILFVFGNSRNPEFLETLFLRRHFLHMTGVKIHHYMTSGEFYNKCLSSRISESDFYLSSDGTTEMKLSVLPALMSIYKNAKMVGIYDESKSFLVTEKVIGNVSACIGFVKDNDYYVPNTVLKEDIRNISFHPQKKVLFVSRKKTQYDKYTEICYKSSSISFEKINLPDKLVNLFISDVTKEISEKQDITSK